MWGVKPTDMWDWAALKAKIAEHGTHNSLLLAPMPTASTAQILGNNEACEPFTNNIYTRRVLSGEFQVCYCPTSHLPLILILCSAFPNLNVTNRSSNCYSHALHAHARALTHTHTHTSYHLATLKVVNKFLLNDLIDAGLWTEGLKHELIAANGSVQETDPSKSPLIAKIPKEIKALYKTVWEISQRTLIDMAADRGA